MSEVISEEERHEAATEEAATVGCPSLGLPKLPGGFDGTEPAPVSEEAKAKLEQSVIRMRQKLTKIADLALAAEAKSNSEHVQLGLKYIENSKAICDIRRICKQSFAEEIAPDYEWLEQIVTSDHFEPECLAKAIEAEASKRPIDYPTFYTPGWLVEMAKKLEKSKSGVEVEQRKHSMDFGRFHVTRAAIPGRTVLTFRRKQEVDEEHGSLVPGRIIVATINYSGVVSGGKMGKHFTVKSYETGETGRVLFAGDSWVSMSKTEKIVYKMVKCDVRETQRRHITRKRKRDAAKQQAHDNKGDAGEVKRWPIASQVRGSFASGAARRSSASRGTVRRWRSASGRGNAPGLRNSTGARSSRMNGSPTWEGCKMREYPEGNRLYWAIIEYGFAAFCAASVAICVVIACGGVK